MSFVAHLILTQQRGLQDAHDQWLHVGMYQFPMKAPNHCLQCVLASSDFSPFMHCSKPTKTMQPGDLMLYN